MCEELANAGINIYALGTSDPGVLGKLAEQLAEAEVNIEYTYLAAGPEPKGV